MVGEKDLRDDVFGVAVNPSMVHEVVVALQANARQPWAHTKNRGEVSGGGKKPWKQKGTGRARHGSSRSPIWVGGGITFGPRHDRDYTKKINKKTKSRALLMTMSDKVKNERLLLIESFGVKDGKTKQMAASLTSLPIKGKTTIVLPVSDPMLMRGSRNLKQVRLVTMNDMSMLDLLSAEYVLMTPEAAVKLEATYGKKTAK